MASAVASMSHDTFPDSWYDGAFIETTNAARDVSALVPCVVCGDVIQPCIIPAANVAYTWEMKDDPAKAPVPLEWLDRTDLYGTHSCGYVLFFKPTLNEVAQLVDASELRGRPGPLYVNTYTCDARGNPSSDPNRCANREGTRHFAYTTVYYQK